MKDVKCNCGHVNPHGTILCESCGRVLAENELNQEIVDMRYEGTARRSQTYKKTLIDKIWNFFSSVKVGVWLIVIILAVSAIGTIFQQEMYIPSNMPAEQFYSEEHGIAGEIYYALGFHKMYGSWWYLLLIASLGISLIICSLDRFVPLYRALKTQRVDRHEQFLRRQRIFGETDISGQEVDFEVLKSRLRERKFKVKEVNGCILAEKNRFSRWGPYVNHIGLIIFLIGGMLRFVPDMYHDSILWVREGETKQIPATDQQYYVKNEKFTVEVYDKETEKEVFSEALESNGMMAKNFQTDAVLYERKSGKVAGEEAELKKVGEHKIKVNEPLKAGSVALYQSDYKLDELSTMSFGFIDKETEKEFGEVKINLQDPKSEYALGNGYVVKIKNYYPDFEMDDNGEPTTKSRVPNNPAFIFQMITPDKPEGEVSFVAIQNTIEAAGENKYKMAFKGVETVNVTALTVRKDHTLPFLGVGGAIFMIGVVQGAYWQHRRIWIQKKGGKLLLAGHTNKNWHGLKTDLKKTIDGLGLSEPEDKLDQKKS